jgi:hypothetical protein
MKLKRRYWISVVFAILIIISIWVYANRSSQVLQTRDEILDFRMHEHTNINLHIHPYLDIEILGDNITLPSDIGIDDSGMRVIHTHDTSSEGNKLHIESPIPYQFYLGDFFAIWNKTFNETCIFEHCIDSMHELKIYVNDAEKETYQYTPLKDADRIRIIYRVKK